MKRYIVANAMKKSDIGALLEEHTYPCMESLSQLYLFPDYTEYHKHWAREVWANLHRVSKLKKSNKYPKAQYIFDQTWMQNETHVEAAMDEAVNYETNLIPNESRLLDADTLYKIMDEYFTWIAEKLSKNGIVLSQESYQKLKELNLLE